MITEEKVIEILKQFEQQDYKRGGVSIDTSNYSAIARTVVKKCSIPDVVVPKGTLCDVCGSDDIIEAPSMGSNCNSCNPL